MEEFAEFHGLLRKIVCLFDVVYDIQDVIKIGKEFIKIIKTDIFALESAKIKAKTKFLRNILRLIKAIYDWTQFDDRKLWQHEYYNMVCELLKIYMDQYLFDICRGIKESTSIYNGLYFVLNEMLNDGLLDKKQVEKYILRVIFSSNWFFDNDYEEIFKIFIEKFIADNKTLKKKFVQTVDLTLENEDQDDQEIEEEPIQLDYLIKKFIGLSEQPSEATDQKSKVSKEIPIITGSLQQLEISEEICKASKVTQLESVLIISEFTTSSPQLNQKFSDISSNLSTPDAPTKPEDSIISKNLSQDYQKECFTSNKIPECSEDFINLPPKKRRVMDNQRDKEISFTKEYLISSNNINSKCFKERESFSLENETDDIFDEPFEENFNLCHAYLSQKRRIKSLVH